MAVRLSQRRRHERGCLALTNRDRLEMHPIVSRRVRRGHIEEPPRRGLGFGLESRPSVAEAFQRDAVYHAIFLKVRVGGRPCFVVRPSRSFASPLLVPRCPCPTAARGREHAPAGINEDGVGEAVGRLLPGGARAPCGRRRRQCPQAVPVRAGDGRRARIPRSSTRLRAGGASRPHRSSRVTGCRRSCNPGRPEPPGARYAPMRWPRPPLRPLPPPPSAPPARRWRGRWSGRGIRCRTG